MSLTPTSARRQSHSAAFDAEPSTRSAAGSARRQRRASEVSGTGSGAGARAQRMTDLQREGNAMKVYVRVRPYSERELAHKDFSTHSTIRIDPENPSRLSVLNPSKDFSTDGTFPFTRCFWSVFERTRGNSRKNQVMSDMRDTVDTYLNGGMNSGRIRPRAGSMTTQSNITLSAGGKAGETTAAPAYQGSGSNAAVVEANVAHPPYAGQQEVYKYIGKPILENTMDGYNGCIFAYGQTGSGKTFTMMGYAPTTSELRASAASSRRTTHTDSGADMEGSRSNLLLDSPEIAPLTSDDGEDVVDKTGIDPVELQGIIPRVCVDLFAGMREKRKRNDTLTYRVEVSYYEIYNEKVFDLIRPSKTDLKVGNNPITGPYVDGLGSKIVANDAGILNVIRKGMLERHTAATKFNDRSSRSHAILSINILQIYLDQYGSTTKLESKLNLVDLAGSERAGAAGVDRPEFKEGVNINLSLTVLGRVIDCLADLSKSKALSVPVPYRDSRLTMLLMDSIGGNSQTSMVATVSPHAINYEEMKQTIRYAARAKQIINRAVRNEDPQVAYIRELRSEVDRLQQLLKEAGGHEFTRDYVLELEERCRLLERKCAEQETTIASLRAELDSAGISDPTFHRGANSGGAGGEAAAARSGAALRQATESLQLQLDTARQEIGKLQKELIDRSGTTASAQLQKDQEAKVLKLHRKLDTMDEAVRERENLLRSYATFQMPYTTELLFNTFENKGLAVMRECRQLLTVRGLAMEEAKSKGQVGGLVALNEQQKKHEQEVAEVIEQQRLRHAELENIYEKRDQERQRKHREALASVDAKLQESIGTYEKEKRRMGQERESMRLHYEDVITKNSHAHSEEAKKLREAAARQPTSSDEQKKMNEALRSTAAGYEARIREMQSDMDAAARQAEADHAKVRSQISAGTAKKEAELNDKDRQRRETERQLTALRQENLRILAEAKRGEKDRQEMIKDMTHLQESLVSVASRAVDAWETKAGAPLDTSMVNLKAFIADKENYRQLAKQLAYRGNADAASRRASGDTFPSTAGGGVNGASKARARHADDDAREKEFKEMLASMKRQKEEQQAKAARLRQDAYEAQSQMRTGRIDGDSNVTPPLEANAAATK